MVCFWFLCESQEEYGDFQSFIHQLMHNWTVLKNNSKIYIKIDIKTAPICFGVITIIRERTIRSC
jgi:hypothetical protein